MNSALDRDFAGDRKAEMQRAKGCGRDDPNGKITSRPPNKE
jgi:hypothetical protein